MPRHDEINGYSAYDFHHSTKDERHIKRCKVSSDVPELMTEQEWELPGGRSSDECAYGNSNFECLHHTLAAKFTHRPNCDIRLCPLLKGWS